MYNAKQINDGDKCKSELCETKVLDAYGSQTEFWFHSKQRTEKVLTVDIWTESGHLQETTCILLKKFELASRQLNPAIECPLLPAHQH